MLKTTRPARPSFRSPALGLKNGRPLIIGHRGYPACYPENTLPSFKAAVSLGVDMIELDVTLTRDQELIVIHDRSVDRTTDGQGLVGHKNLDQIKKLDAGQWFAPRFKGTRLPTLREVFQALGKQVMINVEIKPEAVCIQTGDTGVAGLVVGLIKESGLKAWTVVSSFSYDILREVRILDQDLALSVLSRKTETQLDVVKLCQAVDAFSYNPDIRHITHERVRMLHEAGLLVLPWVRAADDHRQSMEKAIRMECDGYFANDPLMWKEVVAVFNS